MHGVAVEEASRRAGGSLGGLARSAQSAAIDRMHNEDFVHFS